MDEIIKKAIEGGWDADNSMKNSWGTDTQYPMIVCDPLFWQALAQTQFKGWGDVPSENFCGWLYHAQTFYRINLTEGWEKAVEYLQGLIEQK